jgi:hypothetical protein
MMTKKTPKGAGADWPVAAWAQFWSRYPHRVGKQHAEKIFDRLRMSKDAPAWGDLMGGLGRYIASKPPDRAFHQSGPVGGPAGQAGDPRNLALRLAPAPQSATPPPHPRRAR